MGYNTKNYMEQGGEKLVIGGTATVTGTLAIAEGATVTGLAADPLLAATATALGGIKAATKGAGDTVECKIDGTSSKLYVAPTAAAKADAAGVVKMVANQADSTATEVAGLVTDFNALLAKLKAAGIMVADA